MAAGVVVTGHRKLDAMLRRLPLAAQKKLSRQATRKAAKDIVLPHAKANAPVDTGDLEDSLVVRSAPRSRSRFGHMVTTRDGLWKGDQFYGAFLEFGTKERFHRSGKPVGRIDPSKHRAFMRPAVYDNESRIKQLYINDLRQLISEAGR